MSTPIIVEDVVTLLQSRYGKAEPFGQSRLYKFGSALSCSINYSKLIGGHKYFFGLSKEVVDPNNAYPETELGDFVLLICGSANRILILPRSLVIEMLRAVPTRKIDIFYENSGYILQTTKHPKLTVTEFLNAFPQPKRVDPEVTEDSIIERPDRIHGKIQWALIQLGRAEGCSVWVPANDRNFSFRRQSFASFTLERLPNFGFDENTRRIVQNIDVLWLTKNVIRKAFEVESTTAIYSGLLRLNDLILSQPNNQIDLYLVASQARREKVYTQLIRPTFQPLIPRCQFLSFESIEEQVKLLEALRLDRETRISGLIRGERFVIPEHYVYPSEV
jgi:hypothetical protein